MNEEEEVEDDEEEMTSCRLSLKLPRLDVLTPPVGSVEGAVCPQCNVWRVFRRVGLSSELRCDHCGIVVDTRISYTPISIPVELGEAGMPKAFPKPKGIAARLQTIREIGSTLGGTTISDTLRGPTISDTLSGTPVPVVGSSSSSSFQPAMAQNIIIVNVPSSSAQSSSSKAPSKAAAKCAANRWIESPPTQKQIDYISILCRKFNLDPEPILREIHTKSEASHIIDTLRSLPRQ